MFLIKEDTIDIVIQHPRRDINRRKFLTEARRVLSLLRKEGYFNGRPVEVSVVLGDDGFLRMLKKKYFGMAHATDVVAFPQEERGQGVKGSRGQEKQKLKLNFSPNPEPGTRNPEPVLLGDVVISLDHAKRQASENGHSYPDEVLYLFIHGTLHLLGFRDAPAVEAARMTVKQNALWDTVRHGNVREKTGTKKSGVRKL